MRFRTLRLLCAVILVGMTAPILAQPDAPAASRMLKRIESRVSENPNDASAWRMLGKLRRKQGDIEGARTALESALQIDDSNTAAHFDLAELFASLGETQTATLHYQNVVTLAPDSNYGKDAEDWLRQYATSPQPVFVDEIETELQPSTFVEESRFVEDSSGAIEQAGFEISRFDNSANVPDADEILPVEDTHNRLRLRLETGVVYNSNVTLTPINRELFPAAQDTAQFFLAPELEYRALDAGDWGAGPTFLGHFTFNEDSFSNLNLQSYQPGAFLERVFSGSPTVVVTRLQYGFTHDAFDGKTIGNRHSLMGSAAAVWDVSEPVEPNGARDLTFSYFSTDHTNILDDGVTPSVTSRDGWTYRLGAAHTFAINRRFLRHIRAGVDLEHADLTGDNFAYDGISTYIESEMPLTDTLTLKTEGGWGYRDYGDFTGTPSRNENIWRAGTRLTKKLNDHWSIAGTFNYDRFDSKNEQFNSDRFLTGIVAIFER